MRKDGATYKITFFHNTTRKLEHNDFLPNFCMLSSLIVEPMENWLQLMLNWDPQQRGGPVDLTLKQPRCFVLMDHILNLKVSLNVVYFIRLTLKLTNLFGK